MWRTHKREQERVGVPVWRSMQRMCEREKASWLLCVMEMMILVIILWSLVCSVYSLLFSIGSALLELDCSYTIKVPATIHNSWQWKVKKNKLSPFEPSLPEPCSKNKDSYLIKCVIQTGSVLFWNSSSQCFPLIKVKVLLSHFQSIQTDAGRFRCLNKIHA